MKFETINNQLCRIVEPEPLTEESKFPCVVRLIQDDSPMGRNNDFYATSHLLAHIEIINCLDATHFVRWQGSKTYYSRFEIIGYPVVDGSHWWALYQMMQGKKVCNPTLAAEKATRLGSYEVEQFNTFWYIVGDAVAEGKSNYGTLSVSSWIAASSSTGWQIYEEPKPKPKPLLADAKGGDLCKRRDGRFVSLSNVPPDSLYWEVGNNLYYQDGRESLDEKRDVDIVYTEPLAPEGSAEWALQMLKLGKPVTNKRVFTAGGYIKATCSDKYHFVQMWGYSGWQLHEEPKPEPEPALKVGDWAKYDIDSYLRVIETPGRERTLCKTLSGVIVYPYTSCLTKVSPSEVVVHIGCLSGPVRRSSSSHFCIICGDHWSMIAFAMLLDTATRELVKALLEAQEEK